MTRPRLEVADVFRDHGDAFLDRYGDVLSPEQRRALRDIAACRTAALGGHVEECDRCGHQRIAYNSCRNRHCPKCQATAAAQWMEARQAELLPGRILSRGLHAPGGARSDRLAEPAGGLRPPVPRRRRDLAADRRRSEAPRGRDRVPGRPAHLGPEPRTSPARALRGAGRRALARRLALGRLSAGVLPPGARAQPRLPGQVPRAAAPRLRAGKALLPREAPRAGGRRRVPAPARRQRRRPSGSCTPSRPSADRSRC